MTSYMRRMVWVGVCVLCAAAAHAGEVNALAKSVPAETLLFASFDGKNPATAKTALLSLLNEPEVKALLEGPLAELQKFLAGEAVKQGGPDPEVLAPLFATRLGLAFVGLAPPAEEGMPPRVELLLLAEVGQGDTPAAKSVNLLLDMLKARIGLAPDAFKPTQVGGVKAMQADLNGTPVTYLTTAQGLFLLGSNDAVTKALDANTTKLSDAKDFQRVREVTGGQELLLLHYAHGPALQRFGMFLPPDVGSFLTNREFGLANVQSLSLAFSPDGPGFRCTAFLRVTGERQGLLQVLAGKPLNPALVKMAPKGTAFFLARSLDVGALWDFITGQIAKEPGAKEEMDKSAFQVLAKANQAVGFDIRKDLIGSLGDEFAVFAPNFTAVVKMKDAEKFKTCVNKLLATMAQEMAKDRDFAGAVLKLNTMPYQGKTITYVDGMRAPLFFQPCYILQGDYAVFALSPMALKDYLQTMTRGETLADQADFQTVRRRMGADASGLYYADSKPLLLSVYEIMPWLLGSAKMVPPEFAAMVPDSAKLPPSSLIARHLFGSTAAFRPLPDGLLAESYSPLGLPLPPEIRQGGLATTAILAGMLLPALTKARTEARSVQSMNNLRQIGMAAMMYATENDGRFPTSLQVLSKKYIEHPKIFLHPNSGTQPRAGRFVTDFDSIFDLANKAIHQNDAPANLPMAWDKRAFSPEGRSVVFFDGSVRRVSEREFQTLMTVRVEPFIKKMKEAKAE